MQRGLLGIWLIAGMSACSSSEPDPRAAEHCEPPAATVSQALSPIDCTESQDTGYSSGTPFPITVVTVDGKPVERDTANAYYVMAQAADKAGVTLKISSGFRTQAEQQYFYNCYINCNCNNCNLAAKPGYSNHQSGHALDLNTSTPGVLSWLNANGATYGFKRTVPSEPWHWEWWSGGPGGGPCAVEYAGKSLGISGQSYPISSQGAVQVGVGETVTGWVKLENVGSATWKKGSVWLAPMPRDKPHDLASPSWLKPHRISTVDSDVAPGQVGTFALDLTGKVLGETLLELGWVAEGVTWFADGPKGGGPDDGYFAVKVNVVPGSGTGGAGGASGAAGAGASWSNGGAIHTDSGLGGTSSSKPLSGGSGDDGGCSVSQRGGAPGRNTGLLLTLAVLALLGRRRQA